MPKAAGRYATRDAANTEVRRYGGTAGRGPRRGRGGLSSDDSSWIHGARRSSAAPKLRTPFDSVGMSGLPSLQPCHVRPAAQERVTRGCQPPGRMVLNVMKGTHACGPFTARYIRELGLARRWRRRWTALATHATHRARRTPVYGRQFTTAAKRGHVLARRAGPYALSDRLARWHECHKWAPYSSARHVIS